MSSSVQPAEAATREPVALLQLRVARPLATVDLSHTLLQRLGPRWRERMLAFMAAHFARLAMTHRVASLAYFLLLVLPPNGLRHVVLLLVLCSLVTLTCTTLFLSIDIAKLLVRTPDVLFMSTVNLVNWACLAALLGDMRWLLCIPSWYSAQVGIFMDANFRTYPTMLRSTIISIPAILSIALCCALDKIYTPRRQNIVIAGKTLSLANIISFCSTTIALLLAKKVFLKYRRQRQAAFGFNVVPCVLVRARLELSPVALTTSLRTAVCDAAGPHIQALGLSTRAAVYIDATDCISRRCLQFHGLLDGSPLPWRVLALLYVIGAVGFTSLCARTFLGVVMGSLWLSQSTFATVTAVGEVCSYVALVCTLAFCGSIAAHFQRDLVRSLFLNFDYVFSSFQVIVMGICLSDTTQGSVPDCISILAWTIWYQWMLTLDALTPPMKRRLRFRKWLARPILVVFLSGVIWVLSQLLFTETFGRSSHVLFEYRVTTTFTYRVTSISMLTERLVTIVGWLGSRLVYEFFWSHEDELLFIRGLVEYASPFETFPHNAVLAQTGCCFPRGPSTNATGITPTLVSVQSEIHMQTRPPSAVAIVQ